MAKKKKIYISQPSVTDPGVFLSNSVRTERLTFNFSFLTADKKYSIAGLSHEDSKIHKKILERIEALSRRDKTLIFIDGKESGLETLPQEEVHFRLNSEYIDSKRDAQAGTKYWVFRLNKQGRVIGKIIGNIFYVLAVDTSFDAYRH
ncbi:hypothetical protein [Lacticaseibacillus paracasei]|jgi:hypothetical protein|uniref:hypothetical protein n=1 Tax=Lacticaseibacillus paracasei TaxID=1597 RepID=UPI002F3D44DA